MTEGKRCEIHLLDNKKLEMILQPKLLSEDLFDIVVSHFNLREKIYFGIWFVNDLGEKRWLRPEKKVLDHNFKQHDSLQIQLTLGVRLHVPSFTFLKDSKTIELFYLQAIKTISKGELGCDVKTMPLLAAYVMQASNGDYISESITNEDFKNMNLFPKTSLSKLCIEDIVTHYKRMAGLRRGDAIVNYLNIVERLPMYGSSFFLVKDKNEANLKLGVSHRGISLHDGMESSEKAQIYTWNRIENLFYREKKFSLEVRSLSRSGSNNSINSLGRFPTINRRSAQKLDVVSWFLANSADCRELWSLSVGYHQLYVQKSKFIDGNMALRTLKDIAKELTISKSSIALSSEESGSPTDSSSQLSFDPDVIGSWHAKLVSALNARKHLLQEILNVKENQLKTLCSFESEFTSSSQLEADFHRGSHPCKKALESQLAFMDNINDPENIAQQLRKEINIQSNLKESAKELENILKNKEIRMLRERASAKLKEKNEILENLRKNKAGRGSKEKCPEMKKNITDFYKGNVFHAKTQEKINSSTKLNLDLRKQSFHSQFSAPVMMPGRAYAPKSSGSILAKRPEHEKYLFGEFGNSGIYSSLQDKYVKHCHDTSTLRGSSSLTQISSATNEHEQTAMKQINSDDLRVSDIPRNHFVTHSLPSPSRDEPYTPKVAKKKSSKQSSSSNFGSLLSSAAWSQLSQPPLERLAQDVVNTPLIDDDLLLHDPFSRIVEGNNSYYPSYSQNGNEENEEATLV